MHVWKVLSILHSNLVSNLVGIIPTPSTFRLALLLLLFVFLLSCLICNSIGNIYFSKHTQSPSVLAHLAVIVHTAEW